MSAHVTGTSGGKSFKDLRQHGAMQLDRRKAQFPRDLGVLDRAGSFERQSLDSLRHVGGGRDCGTTAESLELDVRDDTVVVDLDHEFHDCVRESKSDIEKGARLSGR